MRGLCQQHGMLQYFYMHTSARHAVVTYTSPDEAAMAQRSLDSSVIGGTALAVDFIPDADVTQLSSSVPADLSSIWSAAAAAAAVMPGSEHSVWQNSAAGVWGTTTGGI